MEKVPASVCAQVKDDAYLSMACGKYMELS